MNYQTTKIKPLKSYPTYQFHAYTDSDSLGVNDVFKICVLEIFRWLRLRLNSFGNLLQDLNLPAPEEYTDFDERTLHSFSLELGATINSLYLDKSGIWTLNITESDMGANIGTATERLPVQGRIFSTDIALKKKNDCVEFGVRITCSEPYDIIANCEVFRPTFVKILSMNKNVGFRNHCRIDGEVISISTKNDVERLCDIMNDTNFDMPLVLISDPEEKEIIPVFSEIKLYSNDTISYKFNLGIKDLSSLPINVDMSKVSIELKEPLTPNNSKSSEIKSNVESKNNYEVKKVRPNTIDYHKLAKSLVGFAIVCKVEENCFKILNNKLEIEMFNGDVLLCNHGKVFDEYKFTEYENDLNLFTRRIKDIIKSFPKGNPYSFGEIVFISDARLLEIEEKRNADLTLEEQSELLKQENEELKKQLKEYEQQSIAVRQNSDELRILQKQIKALENENTYCKLHDDETNIKLKQIENAYRRSSEIIDFYKIKSQKASIFPTKKDDICTWIEKEFSSNILLAPRAKSELKKYSGSLNVAMFCDGIYFLNGYADYRKGAISKEHLELYSENCGWDVEFCGKEALKVRRDDYIATVDGEKYLLDLHIKYGVNSQQLIRIYFCWDELKSKVVIGSMPGHLATVKQST